MSNNNMSAEASPKSEAEIRWAEYKDHPHWGMTENQFNEHPIVGVKEESPKEEGMKYDYGKTRFDLILDSMAGAMELVAEVATHGAEKYDDDNWKVVDNGIKRYTAAMYRHQNAMAKGEVWDNRSGLSHAAHAACNALIVLELKIMNGDL